MSSETIVRVAKNLLEPLFVSEVIGVQKAALSVISITVTCSRVIRAEKAVNVNMMQFHILTMNVCLKTMQNDVLGYDV